MRPFAEMQTRALALTDDSPEFLRQLRREQVKQRLIFPLRSAPDASKPLQLQFVRNDHFCVAVKFDLALFLLPHPVIVIDLLERNGLKESRVVAHRRMLREIPCAESRRPSRENVLRIEEKEDWHRHVFTQRTILVGRAKAFDLMLCRRARTEIQTHAVFPLLRRPIQDFFTSGIHSHSCPASANQFAGSQDAHCIGQIREEEHEIRPPLPGWADPVCGLQPVEVSFDARRGWFPLDHAMTSSAGCWGMICSRAARGTN